LGIIKKFRCIIDQGRIIVNNISSFSARVHSMTIMIRKINHQQTHHQA
jgi:hypothetical protein